MMHIFYSNGKEKEVTRLERFKDNAWIHVEEPTDNEIKYAQDTLGLDPSLIRDALDMDELPRIEIEGEIIYIFTRYVEIKEKQITTVPILIAIGKNFLATITPHQFPRLDAMFNKKYAVSNTTQQKMLFTKIMYQIHETYAQALGLISKNVRTLTVLIEKIRNKDIVRFVLFENDLHDFSFTLIKTNNDLNNIMTGKFFSLTINERALIEDIYLSNAQLIDICNENIRTIINLRDAYSTIMTNNLNRVIKLFTSLTIILTIPTIVASFFGMNVTLPPLAFFEIISITLFICIIMIAFFMRQDWL